MFCIACFLVVLFFCLFVVVFLRVCVRVRVCLFVFLLNYVYLNSRDFSFSPPILFSIPLGVGVRKWLCDAELSAKLNHSNQSVKAKRPWLGPLHL